MQHYGIATRWIDAVDNIWIALWFAAHRIITRGRYAHVVRERQIDSVRHFGEVQGQEGFFAQSDKRVFIIAIGLPGRHQEVLPGVFRAPLGRVVDLRRAAPSYFLRPHTQHGVLIRPTADEHDNLEYAFFSIRLVDALDWLGEGLAVSSYALFPPATVDDGYHALLTHVDRWETGSPKELLIYGPGY